jgi:hypothetical protein
VHQHDEIRVVEHVSEFVGLVSEIDVDRDGPELERCHHRLDPLHAVHRVDADVGVLGHTVVRQMVGEPVRALLELLEGAPFAIANNRRTVAHEIDGVLYEVGEIESHGKKVEHVLV